MVQIHSLKNQYPVFMAGYFFSLFFGAFMFLANLVFFLICLYFGKKISDRLDR
jgi:hypothetical protein